MSSLDQVRYAWSQMTEQWRPPLGRQMCVCACVDVGRVVCVCAQPSSPAGSRGSSWAMVPAGW